MQNGIKRIVVSFVGDKDGLLSESFKDPLHSQSSIFYDDSWGDDVFVELGNSNTGKDCLHNIFLVCCFDAICYHPVCRSG